MACQELGPYEKGGLVLGIDIQVGAALRELKAMGEKATLPPIGGERPPSDAALDSPPSRSQWLCRRGSAMGASR